MEIKPNSNVDAVARAPVSPAKPRTAPAGADTAAFAGVEALEQALRATPDVRPEKVDQARQFIGDVNYPPTETIKRISALLALNLDENPTDGSSNKKA